MSEGARTGCYLWIATTILVSAIVGWFAWHQASWLTEQRIHEQQSTEQHVRHAEDNISSECADLEGVAFRDCVHEQYKAAYEHHRANHDLDAQQEMALYTRVMGITAVVGILLGLGSVALIFYTLRATQEMAADTRRIGEAQVRAYLSITKADMRIEFRPKLTEKMPDIDIGLYFSNSGQTPAVNISYFCWAEASTHNDIEVFSDLDEYDFHDFTNTVAANSEARRSVICFGILNAITEGSKLHPVIADNPRLGDFPIIKMNGVVFYQDIFGKEFKSHFSFWIDAPKKYGFSVSSDDLGTVQAIIPVFEQIESRAAYIADEPDNEG